MSRPESAPGSSQQKRTALQLIGDGERFKRPSLNDFKEDQPFQRPSLSEMRDDPLVNFSMEMVEEPAYTPYTVDDYRRIKMADEVSTRGGLGPSYDEEWERKREMRVRQMQIAKRINAETSSLPKRKPKEPKPKPPTKWEIMKEYGRNLPKPKPRAKSAKPKREPKPVKASYDIDAELQRHYHFVSRVRSLAVEIQKYLDA